MALRAIVQVGRKAIFKLLDPLYNDPLNAYSFISPGYSEKPGKFNIVSWFISSSAVQDIDKDLVFTTEFYISLCDESGEVVSDYRMDLWDLICVKELSESTILGGLYS